MADGGGRGGNVRDCDVAAGISVGVAVTDIVIVVAGGVVVDTAFVVAPFVSAKSLTGRKTLVTDGTLVHLPGGGGGDS